MRNAFTIVLVSVLLSFSTAYSLNIDTVVWNFDKETPWSITSGFF